MQNIAIFTKSWKELPLKELAALISDMGVDGVELPVRDGYQVNFNNLETELYYAQEVFKEKGLRIISVASELNKSLIEVMGNMGIQKLRVMINIDMNIGYFKSVESYRSKILEYEEILRKNRVQVIVQNHYNYWIGSALGLYDLLKELPNDIISACLDFAHCSLSGEPVDMAIDILKDRISMVNFKSAMYVRLNTKDEAEWKVLWGTYKDSLYNWMDAIRALKKINYTGDICLPAEYGRLGLKGQIMGNDIILLIEEDLDYLKKHLNQSF